MATPLNAILSPDATSNAFTRTFDALWQDMDRNYGYFKLKPEIDWNGYQ
jgi:hypothetical protein